MLFGNRFDIEMWRRSKVCLQISGNSKCLRKLASSFFSVISYIKHVCTPARLHINTIPLYKFKLQLKSFALKQHRVSCFVIENARANCFKLSVVVKASVLNYNEFEVILNRITASLPISNRIDCAEYFESSC